MSTATRQGRAAFLLNANAKSVTKGLLRKISERVPKKDLYVSKNLGDAHSNIAQILRKQYAYVFCGGGDGTVISTINLLNEFRKSDPLSPQPYIGVLGLGTGNAIARFLHADRPEHDIEAILSGKPVEPVDVSMIETSSGFLTPFAGIGYDGELMNDFESVKEIFFESPFRKFFSSVLGYTIAGVFKTIPRQIARELPTIRITSSYPAYQIKNVSGSDEEIYLEQGKTLYDGIAPVVCVGTVPLLGYGIKMFPFASRRPGYMQLRVSAVPIPTILTNLYPAIWNGSFRHKKLYDFLVKDVSIESDESLPYQLGGDVMGYRKKLYFKVSQNPVPMASLTKSAGNMRFPGQPLLTPLM